MLGMIGEAGPNRRRLLHIALIIGILEVWEVLRILLAVMDAASNGIPFPAERELRERIV